MLQPILSHSKGCNPCVCPTSHESTLVPVIHWLWESGPQRHREQDTNVPCSPNIANRLGRFKPETIPYHLLVLVLLSLYALCMGVAASSSFPARCNKSEPTGVWMPTLEHIGPVSVLQCHWVALLHCEKRSTWERSCRPWHHHHHNIRLQMPPKAQNNSPVSCIFRKCQCSTWMEERCQTTHSSTSVLFLVVYFYLSKQCLSSRGTLQCRAH